MLFEAHPEIDIHEMSPLALAFAGDAVLELLVRQRLVETSRLQPGCTAWQRIMYLPTRRTRNLPLLSQC